MTANGFAAVFELPAGGVRLGLSMGFGGLGFLPLAEFAAMTA